MVFYRGTNLNTLQWISTADGPGEFYTEPGSTYQIQVTTRFTAGGPDVFSLAASYTPKPTNDQFTNSIQIEGSAQSIRSYILSPTVEPGEPLVTNTITGTIWWSWAAPTNGRVRITPASFPDVGAAKFQVYTGPVLSQLSAVAGRRLTLPDGPFVFSAKAGEIYHIQLWARANNISEPTGFDLELFPYGPAVNDNFADAALIGSGPLPNLGATREVGEPQHRDGGPNKSLWWRFEAGANTTRGTVRLGQGTLTNVTIAVYRGSSVDTLTLVGKGKTVSFDTDATEVYSNAAETAASDDGDIEVLFQNGRPTATPKAIPGNLVLDPSFEDFLPVWDSIEVGGVFSEIGADGQNFPFTGSSGRLWQTIPTIVGEPYRLRFAYANEQEFASELQVSAGGKILGTNYTGVGGRAWNRAEYIFNATTNQTTIEFKGFTYSVDIDQVSVIWLSQPPTIVTQPASLSIFAGTDVLFNAGVTGAAIIVRQWYFKGEPIDGATGNYLQLTNVTAANAGEYFLRATNAYGHVESDHFTLTVEPAASPQIVLQPQGDLIAAGQFYVLQTAAVGTPPLRFQWLRDNAAIPGATNSSLTFASFTAGDAGVYTVQVGNGGETATSLPATLALANSAPTGGGVIDFANFHYLFPYYAVPIYDADGVTRLSGSNFVAQLYAGPTEQTLRAVGQPRPFLTGFNYGYWAEDSVLLPNVVPGDSVVVQARAWDRRVGASYETARALGGKFGRSALLHLAAGDGSIPPRPGEGTPMETLTSFHLQAGLPNFVTGQLSLLETQADGKLVWKLTGAAGFRYLIERKTDGANWLPFQTLENQTGEITFADTPDPAATAQLYRARMLD